MTKIQKLIVGISVLLLVAMLGCAAFQDGITPCWVDEEAKLLSGANVPKFLPYTTVSDAKYVLARLDYVRSMNELEYNYLRNNMVTHLAESRDLQQALFSPEGPIGLLLPTLSAFGLGALLISKPQDKKEIEKLKNGGK